MIVDPEKCLIEASRLVKTDRWDCAEKLADYFDWRIRGGFEPWMGERRNEKNERVSGMKGDKFYRQVLIQLGLVADTLSEALSTTVVRM